MKRFENLISDQTVEALKRFLGLPLSEAYLPPGAEFRFISNDLSTPSLALRFCDSDEYIVLQSDWVGDTENHMIDAHKFELSFSSKVDFIQSEKVQHRETQLTKIMNPTLAVLYQPQAVLERVEIFEKLESADDESVRFDCGIVFHTTHENPIVVQCTDEIAGGLDLHVSKKAYEDLKSQSRVRKKISK